MHRSIGYGIGMLKNHVRLECRKKKVIVKVSMPHATECQPNRDKNNANRTVAIDNDTHAFSFATRMTHASNSKSEFQFGRRTVCCVTHTRTNRRPHQHWTAHFCVTESSELYSFHSSWWSATVRFDVNYFFFCNSLAICIFICTQKYLNHLKIQNEWATNKKDQSVGFGSIEGNDNDCRRYRWFRRYVKQCLCQFHRGKWCGFIGRFSCYERILQAHAMGTNELHLIILQQFHISFLCIFALSFRKTYWRWPLIRCVAYNTAFLKEDKQSYGGHRSISSNTVANQQPNHWNCCSLFAIANHNVGTVQK